VIEHDLRGADTRLAAMFGVFTELTWQEKMPLAEMFLPVRWWTRTGRLAARRQRSCTLPGCRRPGCRPASRLGTIVLLPLLLAATLSLLLLGVLTPSPAGAGRCAQLASFRAPVRLTAGAGCAAPVRHR
jgi:hypothetical protein